MEINESDEELKKKLFQAGRKVVLLLVQEVGNPVKAYYVLSFCRQFIKDYCNLELTNEEPTLDQNELNDFGRGLIPKEKSQDATSKD